jgi:hypothetical protein
LLPQGRTFSLTGKHASDKKVQTAYQPIPQRTPQLHSAAYPR